MGAVQQNGTGTIVGQIVDADSGKPIPGAIVTIGGAAVPQAAPAQGRIQVPPTGGGGPVTIGGPGQNPRVLSDGDGRFAFRSLPKGSYNFTAQKPGFVDGAYGRLRPGGSSQSVDLADGENRGDVKVRLFRFASISGIVVDESGEPIVGAQIRAFRRSLVAGTPHAQRRQRDGPDRRPRHVPARQFDSGRVHHRGAQRADQHAGELPAAGPARAGSDFDAVVAGRWPLAQHGRIARHAGRQVPPAEQQRPHDHTRAAKRAADGLRDPVPTRTPRRRSRRPPSP